MLCKSPGFTILAVTALALGIGANCAIFSVVNAVLLTPLPYSDPRHLYEISGSSLADFFDLRQRRGAFSKLAVNRMQSFTLADGNSDAERVYAGRLSADCLPILGVPSLLGRTFLDDDFRPGTARVTLLSYRLWQSRYHGDRQILGREIGLNGDGYTVIGVMPPQFQFPHPVYALWTPWIMSSQETADRTDRGWTVLARLRPGVMLTQAQAELDALATADWHPHVTPTKLGSAD